MADTRVFESGLARSPLTHLASELMLGSVDGARAVRLREIPFLTMIALRIDPGTPAAERLTAVLGAPLPSECGAVGVGAVHQVLWLGPDEFLVVSPDDATLLTASLTAALGEAPGLVVDVSANRTTLELSGPSARSVLEKGCMLDLHPRAFSAGTAVSTLLGPVPVVLWQTDETPTYRILPRSSFAEFTARWLLDSMREFAGPEVP